MRTFAVLPVKSFGRAKQRLADEVGGGDRRELAAAMVADVLGALDRVAGLAGVLVVSAEPLAGRDVVHDPEERGQSAAAERGIRAAVERGAQRVLLVPGDCPALDPDDVGRLLGRGGRAPHVVIVPDRHGTGTNALLLSPPDAIAPAFGPGSFARHKARARAAGATAEVCELPSLALDVDTPGDLAALRAALETRADAAPRTRATIARLVGAC